MTALSKQEWLEYLSGMTEPERHRALVSELGAFLAKMPAEERETSLVLQALEARMRRLGRAKTAHDRRKRAEDLLGFRFHSQMEPREALCRILLRYDGEVLQRHQMMLGAIRQAFGAR